MEVHQAKAMINSASKWLGVTPFRSVNGEICFYVAFPQGWRHTKPKLFTLVSDMAGKGR